MATFEITYVDGSRELIEADSHERASEYVDFVRTIGAAGEERWVRIEASRIATIVERSS